MKDDGAKPAGAVFLSYASQDAEAAKRICAALRAAGIEVWFDQSELRGGDAWDQRIRGQIRECALFMPIISANTNARAEGYFRLEWHLAEQRTYLMAQDRPFLVPVVVDATSDVEARVPERFYERQWTRLPGGEASGEFCERVRKLLEGETVGHEVRFHTVAGAGAPAPAAPSAGHRPSVSAMAGAAIALLAITVIAVWRPWESKVADASGASGSGTRSVSAVSDAKVLLRRAQKILREGDDMNRENVFFAEELLKKAAALDSTDAEILSAQALLSLDIRQQYLYDISSSRLESIRVQAERALKLAPESDYAELAYASYLCATKLDVPAAPSLLEGQKRLRALVAKAPNNRDFRRALAWSLTNSTDPRDEIFAEYERSHAIPGGDEVAMVRQGMSYFWQGRFAEAERSCALSLAVRPSGRAQILDVLLKLCWRGDLDAAMKAMEAWPAWLLLEERGAFVAGLVWLWRGVPDQALAAFRTVKREYFRDTLYTGPRAVLEAVALEAAGRPDAVNALCDRALRVIENIEDDWLGLPLTKAALLARTGKKEAAESELRAWVQTYNRGSYILPRADFWTLHAIYDLHELVNKRTVASFPILEKVVSGENPSKTVFPRAALRLNPAFETWWKDPRFAALLERAPAPDDNPAPRASAMERSTDPTPRPD